MTFVYALKKNRKLKQKHERKLLQLKKKYEIHSNQLGLREQHLNRYDFLKYNLSEALVVQPKINQL